MQVTWVHDFRLTQYLGGAELSDHYWIKKGREMGIDVKEQAAAGYLIESDYYVISNATRIKKSILEQIRDSGNYTLVYHGQPSDYGVEGLQENAKRICFMSPAHEAKFGGEMGNENRSFYPPFIDRKLFPNRQEDRIPNSCLYIGRMEWHKGIETIVAHVRKNPELTADFYGSGRPDVMEFIKESERCFYHPEIQNKNVAGVMNQFENYIWFLNRFGSYGRTLIEAIYCGVDLIVGKENFGLFSYDWDFNDPDDIEKHLKQGLKEFWTQLLIDSTSE